MPHKCMKCGRVFDDGTVDVLQGCPVCGGKKFVYVGIRVTIPPPRETRKEIPTPPADSISSVESVRVLGKGNYELNLERMAEGPEVIIGVGKTGKYILDLPSMSKEEMK